MTDRSLEVAIAATGIANVASVEACLRRLGAEPRLTLDRDELEAAAAVVLPGVGAFAAGMQALRDAGVADVLSTRAREGRPLLAICLGMQLLGAESDESPGTLGLGVAPFRAVRMEAAPRLPHFGWNRVSSAPKATEGFVETGDAYFAHSYAALPDVALQREGWRLSTAVEGAPFVAAIERGGTLACQFHPELSGAFGAALIERWLAAAQTPNAPRRAGA